jgi:hypothetical protein
VIDKILGTKDEAEALRQANEERGKKQATPKLQEMFPPIVTLVSPDGVVETAETFIKISVEARTHSGQIFSVRPFVDGRPLEVFEIKFCPGGKYEMGVPIPERDCTISVLAEDKHGTSVPALLRVLWKGDEFKIKPNLYILAVGVNKYDNVKELSFSVKDVGDFTDAFLGQKGAQYQDVQVKTILDEKAKKERIISGLQWLEKITTQNDVGILFLSGHGGNDEDGDFYYLPVETDPNQLRQTGLPSYEIKKTITKIAGKSVLFIDACHSGNVFGRGTAIPPNPTKFINELISDENGLTVFTSSTRNQYSLENSEWGNGAFTKAVVEGINGKADLMNKGKITINSLGTYVADRVPELTNGSQNPTKILPNSVPDFPLAIVR